MEFFDGYLVFRVNLFCDEKRELAGLAEAMKEFNLKHGMLLTYNQENTVKHDGYEIPVLPTRKWLIQESQGTPTI